MQSPSVYGWIKEIWYIYTMQYYLTIRKDEILPLATKWVDLITLSKIGQIENVKNHIILIICGI